MVDVSRRLLRPAVLLCVIAPFACTTAWSDRTAQVTPSERQTSASKGKTSGATRNRAKNTQRRTLDPKLEQSVLQMVDAHLPDIKVLLDQLRDKEPAQYDTAIRNLAKSSRRLQLARNRGDQAYEIELRVIQSQSAINLLIAKLKMRDNKKDRDALMAETRQLQQAEVERARYELAGLKSRLEKLTQQADSAQKRLNEKQSDLEDRIKKDFQTYLRKSGRK